MPIDVFYTYEEIKYNEYNQMVHFHTLLYECVILISLDNDINCLEIHRFCKQIRMFSRIHYYFQSNTVLGKKPKIEKPNNFP